MSQGPDAAGDDEHADPFEGPEVRDAPQAASPTQPLGLWWLGVLGVAVAGTLLVSQNLRAYGYAVGVTLGLLALLRAVLPAERVGAVVVRGRTVDVVTLLVLGSAIAVLAYTLRLN